MKNEKVDAFIKKAQPFAQPIISYLRDLILETDVNLVEVIKWGFPNYTYNGAIICSFSAFKEHCSFGFWLGAELPDPHGILNQQGKTAMGNLGKITNLNELPDKKILQEYILSAIELAKKGHGKSKTATKKESKPDLKSDAFPEIFDNFPKEALIFDTFPPSHRREYLDWILDAKSEETKNKRISTMFEWITEGKSRNWKYEKK